MKKIIAVSALVIATLVATLTACNKGGGISGGGEHQHQFEKIVDSTFLKSEETCESGAVYYKACPICLTMSDETYVVGTGLGHKGGESTCVKGAVCTRCGKEYGKLLPHNFDDGVTIEPTCTKDGETTKTCLACGKTEKIVLPASHKGEWYITAKARCFDDGEEQRICSVCDTIEHRSIPQIGHHELEDATCIAGKKCKNCRYTEGVGTGHVFPTDWTVKAGCAPTCVNSGIEEHACMICGETEERVVNALGHKGNWIISDYATCTQNGKETKTCTVCGELVGTRTIYSTGHKGTWNTTVEPTCSSTGKATLTCTECYETQEKTLNKLAHNYGDWEIVTRPECGNEKNGQKKHTCTVCGNVDTAIIPYMHSYSEDETNWYRTEPTCTTDGKIEKPCYVCQKETAKCIITLRALGHEGEWQIIKAATCTEEGIKTQTCTRCNQVTNLTINKLGHDMSAGTCTTLPTCSRCGHTEGEANHDYSTIAARIIEDPDCERYGYKILTCSKCGEEKTESIHRLGHKFSENIYDEGWVQTINPTCTTDGKYRKVCLICGKAYDRKIEKLGHDMVDGDCTKPYHCSRCDYQKFVGHTYGDDGCTKCGLTYTDVTYELSQDGTYYIVTAINTGDVKNVLIRPTYNSKPIKEIKCTMPNTVETVVLSDNIEVINENTFNSCTNLTSITLGTGINRICANAFYNCTSLKNVLFESIDNLFDAVFEDITSSPFAYGATIYIQGTPINEIIVPNSVTKINDNIFYGCETITKITFGNNVESVGKYSFANCSNLTSIIMNNGLKTISSYAFYNCNGFSTITLPDSVTKLDICCFYNCANLKNITIPDNVVELDKSSFYMCSNLESINVSPNNTKYSSESGILYNKEKTQLILLPEKVSGEIVIPVGITVIDGWLFHDKQNITKVTLPESIQYIRYNAFIGCTNLESIIIPNGVKGIYDSAFKNCTSLKTLSLPATLEIIDISALEGCSNLESITVDINNQKYLSENGILYNKDQTEIFFVPKTTSGDIVIPDTVLSGSYKFAGCSQITQLTIGAGVQDNLKDGLSTCGSLKKIIVSPDNALYSSDENGILYDKNKTKILCVPLCIEGKVAIANTVTEIKGSAFKDRTKLTDVVIPNSVTWIGRFAFTNCTNLKSVTMLDGDNVITYFGDNSFRNCTNLTSIRLSNAVQSMEDQLFYNCKNLTSIYIPASVMRINARYNWNGFFDGCQKTLKIYCEVDSKQEDWGEYWNYCDDKILTVEWGVTREQYEKIISQIQE